ncbi:MAG: hypothetical protein ACE5GZ_12970 [Gammaproteobacteria bacterium]
MIAINLLQSAVEADYEDPEFGDVGEKFQPTALYRKTERLARQFGYTGGRLTEKEESGEEMSRNPSVLSIRGDVQFRKQLDKEGYQLLDAIDERGTGMQAMVVKEKNNYKIFIVFRGTEVRLKTCT